MVGEVKEWFALADDLFLGAGDVIKSAIVTTKAQGAYDSATGTYLQTLTAKPTQALKTEMNKEFISEKGSAANEFEAWMVRGSDFAVIVGDVVTITKPEANEEFTVEGQNHLIERVDDPTGIGAYFLLHVKEK